MNGLAPVRYVHGATAWHELAIFPSRERVLRLGLLRGTELRRVLAAGRARARATAHAKAVAGRRAGDTPHRGVRATLGDCRVPTTEAWSSGEAFK